MTFVLDKLAKTCYVRYVAISFGNFTVFEESMFVFVFENIDRKCATFKLCSVLIYLRDSFLFPHVESTLSERFCASFLRDKQQI